VEGFSFANGSSNGKNLDALARCFMRTFSMTAFARFQARPECRPTPVRIAEPAHLPAGRPGRILSPMAKSPRARATAAAASAPAPGKPSALLDTRVVYCGDNLEQLQKLPDGCVDLIYIDPPFNSNRNYEVFWGRPRKNAPLKTATPPRRPTSTTCAPAASNSPASSKRPAAFITTGTMPSGNKWRHRNAAAKSHI
jgi:hypothetical protein